MVLHGVVGEGEGEGDGEWWSVANEWKVWWVIELRGSRGLYGGTRAEG